MKKHLIITVGSSDVQELLDGQLYTPASNSMSALHDWWNGIDKDRKYLSIAKSAELDSGGNGSTFLSLEHPPTHRKNLSLACPKIASALSAEPVLWSREIPPKSCLILGTQRSNRDKEPRHAAELTAHWIASNIGSEYSTHHMDAYQTNNSRGCYWFNYLVDDQVASAGSEPINRAGAQRLYSTLLTYLDGKNGIEIGFIGTGGPPGWIDVARNAAETILSTRLERFSIRTSQQVNLDYRALEDQEEVAEILRTRRLVRERLTRLEINDAAAVAETLLAPNDLQNELGNKTNPDFNWIQHVRQLSQFLDGTLNPDNDIYPPLCRFADPKVPDAVNVAICCEVALRLKNWKQAIDLTQRFLEVLAYDAIRASVPGPYEYDCLAGTITPLNDEVKQWCDSLPDRLFKKSNKKVKRNVFYLTERNYDAMYKEITKIKRIDNNYYTTLDSKEAFCANHKLYCRQFPLKHIRNANTHRHIGHEQLAKAKALAVENKWWVQNSGTLTFLNAEPVKDLLGCFGFGELSDEWSSLLRNLDFEIVHSSLLPDSAMP